MLLCKEADKESKYSFTSYDDRDSVILGWTKYISMIISAREVSICTLRRGVDSPEKSWPKVGLLGK